MVFHYCTRRYLKYLICNLSVPMYILAVPYYAYLSTLRYLRYSTFPAYRTCLTAYYRTYLPELSTEGIERVAYIKVGRYWM